MNEILLLLLKLGAHKKPVKLTTGELGAEAGMSQQSASRKLMALEAEGLVARTPKGVMLTKKAYERLAEGYVALKNAFDSRLEISGTIVQGLGEGAYYMGLDGYREQIKEKIGFDPHPGTLNIRLGEEDRWKKEQLLSSDAIIIAGFTNKERTYGDLYAYPCRLENHDCAVIIPLRTSHGHDILEIICGFDIKRKLRKKDGDMVRVVF